MQYIIMCGGDYSDQFITPKPLLEICGEKLVERTIRLLKENGIKNIAISTNNPLYDYLDVKKLHHDNDYIHDRFDTLKKSEHCWLNAYYPTNEPSCYLAGDVCWSNEAIKTIVETEVTDTMFFAIPGIFDNRQVEKIKPQREPLGFKVVNQEHFRRCINEIKELIDNGTFKVDPVSWTLYKVLNNQPIAYDNWNNEIFDKPGNLVRIDDYTMDIDSAKDIPLMEQVILREKMKEAKMVRIRLKEDLQCSKMADVKEIVRANIQNNEPNIIYNGDIILCTNELGQYLDNKLDRDYKPGNNPMNRKIEMEILEVIPDKKEEKTSDEKPKRRTRKAK